MKPIRQFEQPTKKAPGFAPTIRVNARTREAPRLDSHFGHRPMQRVALSRYEFLLVSRVTRIDRLFLSVPKHRAAFITNTRQPMNFLVDAHLIISSKHRISTPRPHPIKGIAQTFFEWSTRLPVQFIPGACRVEHTHRHINWTPRAIVH